MKKSEKSKLIKALSALVEKNGPEFPSEHPTEMVEKLVERCGESVREYEVGEVGEVEKEKIEIMPDGLGVRVGEQYISSEEIWEAVPDQEK